MRQVEAEQFAGIGTFLGHTNILTFIDMCRQGAPPPNLSQLLLRLGGPLCQCHPQSTGGPTGDRHGRTTRRRTGGEVRQRARTDLELIFTSPTYLKMISIVQWWMQEQPDGP
ncbi:hypothetical protein GCM10010221_43670 [Streptomyces parvus]|nr:hypothetical protein GCM10010221_43670 [Streptomyces parvus]